MTVATDSYFATDYLGTGYSNAPASGFGFAPRLPKGGRQSLWNFLYYSSSPGTDVSRISVMVGTSSAGTVDFPVETTTITPAISSAEVPRAIGEIRAYLGLNTTELAGALGVTRQAIYDWVNGGTVKAANRCKVAALLEIAGQWRSLGGEPMGPAVLELPEYGKLVSLLKEVPLDRDAVQRVLEGIHAKMEEAKATALPSARDLAERYGIKPKSESEYRKTVRMVSRHMRGRI